MDISGRAIAFYEYQVSQELCFQSMLQSNIEDKYNSLREQYNMMSCDFNNILKGKNNDWSITHGDRVFLFIIVVEREKQSGYVII